MILRQRSSNRFISFLIWLVSHGGLAFQFLILRALFGFWPALISSLVVWAWLTGSFARQMHGTRRFLVAVPLSVVELDSHVITDEWPA
jgi:hypothetical protein